MKIKEKPITRKVMDEVLRITEKSMSYNNTSTEQELTGSKPTFFVQFSGHIGTITVFCYPNGYVADGKFEYCGGKNNIQICEDEHNTEEDISISLNRVISDMDRFYNDWLSRQEAAPDV